MQALLDHIGGLGLCAATLGLFGLGTELGHRAGLRRRAAREADVRAPHAGVVLGAMLGLLGLLLGFSFSIAEERFAQRKALVLEEANAIGTAYLRANAVAGEQADKLQDLLRAYVDVRLSNVNPDSLPILLKRSEALHTEMWRQARTLALAQPDSEVVSLLLSAINSVIDLHEERVTTAIYNRLPLVLLGTLYAISLISMATLGYSTGLAGFRATFSTLGVAVAVSLVLVLIIDLDRPWQHLFGVSQAALGDVRRSLTQTF